MRREAAVHLLGGPIAGEWKRPQQIEMPSSEDIQIWRFRWGGAAHPRLLGKLLSEEEVKRARSYRRRSDRQRSVVAWAAVRIVIAAALKRHPKELRFSRTCCYCGGRHGKPRLAQTSSVHFNFSHSGGLILLALAVGREVGVDLERIRHNFDWKQVAEVALAEGERRWLQSLPAQRQTQEFFRLWVCREAQAKVFGRGLAGLEDKSVRMQDLNHCELRPAPGYIGAVAAPGGQLNLRLLAGDSLLQADPTGPWETHPSCN